ncbi:MAG: zinc ribbon domain-containing protein [Candidatus Methylomirabilia bacterium]
MPIYEYSCPKCGVDFEKLVSGQWDARCPSCGSPDVKRLVSLVGVKSGSTFVASRGGGCGCTPGGCGCR